MFSWLDAGLDLLKLVTHGQPRTQRSPGQWFRGHPARESPTPCTPFINAWALGTECGVIAMPGVDTPEA